MLVLTRKKGEKIRIGDIEITVLEVSQSGRLKIGIVAPKDVVILRAEINEENATLETTCPQSP